MTYPIDSNKLDQFLAQRNRKLEVNPPIKLNLGKLRMEKLLQEQTTILDSFKVDIVTKNLPTFSGKRNELYHFCNSVDQIVKLCQPIRELPSYKIITQNIRSKIIENASESLTTHNIATNWTDIRAHLITNYADTRSTANLQLELFSLIKLNLEPQKLFDRIQSILTLLSNKIQMDGLDQGIIDALIKQQQSTGLTVFMASLPEPLGSALRASQPVDLQTAHSFVQQEQSIQRLKNIQPQKQKFNNYPKNFQQNNNENRKQNFVKETIKLEDKTSNEKRSYTPQYKQPYRSQNKNFLPRNFIKQETNINNLEQTVDDEDFSNSASHPTLTS